MWVDLWPRSGPGSSSASWCVWGSPWCWQHSHPSPASVCCQGRCTFPSGPRRRCRATVHWRKNNPNPVRMKVFDLTCSEPRRDPCHPSGLSMTCGWSWAAGERTLGRPCQATGCNGTVSPSARCPAPFGSTAQWMNYYNRKWGHKHWVQRGSWVLKSRKVTSFILFLLFKIILIVFCLFIFYEFSTL